MIDEPTNSDLMQVVVFAEGQGFSDQIGAALAQGIVEPFDMGGFARAFRTDTMPLPREDCAIALPIISGTDGAFAVIRGQ